MAANLISAPTTPFTADGEVDLDAARKLYLYLEPHVDGVFVSGTMGEFPALSQRERLDLFEVALDVFGARRVIGHVGTECRRNTISLAVQAAALGVERLAVITPFYLPATADEVTEYLRRVTESADGQWFGYLFRERTGVPLGPDETAGIVAASGLTGLKISGADSGRLAAYVQACPPGVEIYSGNDAGLPDIAAAGGAGVVSGFSSAFPLTFRRLTDALAEGDRGLVDAAQADVIEVLAALGQSIGAAKVAISLRGLCEPHARMTLQPPNEAEIETIRLLVERYG